jgi:hypothetical protein
MSYISVQTYILNFKRLLKFYILFLLTQYFDNKERAVGTKCG